MMLGLIITFILETIGIWFLNTQMTIPAERMMAANVVYQLSIISFLFHIVSVPFLALIVAHEKMNVFAYVGIFDALGRLAIVFILMWLTYDKLILYGILILLLSICVAMSYVIYCWKHYSESSYHWYWKTEEVKELFGFSGWHFLGTFSTTCRSQGINILLNMFFNPAVNAARAVAFQVNGAIMQLSTNFFTAIKPQIYKSYAKQEYQELFKLMMRATIICAFLISVVAFPILADTPFILGLWLKQVPDYAVVFTQLALINGLIDGADGPLVAAALATGKIRKYMLIVTTLILANIPISFVALELGCEPTITMVISICISMISLIVRGGLLKQMIGFPFKQYLVLMLKLTLVTIIMFLGIKFTIYNQVNNIGMFVLLGVVLSIVLTLLYACIIDKSDRSFILHFAKKKLHIKK